MAQVFSPTGNNVSITVSTSSASSAVPVSNATSAGKRVIRLTNNSPLAAPILMTAKTGVGSQTATVADVPVNPGGEIILPYPDDHTHVGVIGSGSSSLYAQPGVLVNIN
jgi:hypothetical protein